VTERLDPLDAFFEDARPDDPPTDLVERILAAAGDPQTRQAAYWSDVGESARRALLASAAALLVSASLAWLTIAQSVQSPPLAKQPNTNETKTEAGQLDPTEQLAISSEPLEQQLAGGFFLLGNGER
jgi:hypothetical protein